MNVKAAPQGAAYNMDGCFPVAPHRPAVGTPPAGPDLEGPFMAVINAFAQDAVDRAEPLTVDAAYAHSCSVALEESAPGTVGLEIESHLVDLESVADAVSWARVEAVTPAMGAAAGPSSVTVEPGGQIELSGPPEPDIVAAVTALRYQSVGVRLALADRGLGLAFAGADPARPSRRVNPRPRYRAMEEHYGATGRAVAGQVMMNSTAALQVNLQAGPKRGWGERVALAYRLGPTLVAIAASSPWLHGRDTGWKSARQRAWSGLDPRACGPVPGCVAPTAGGDAALDPATAWAKYAMRAPVAFVAAGQDVCSVSRPVSFEQWASGDVRLGNRAPTAADLQTHLTTLFPPVRLRGYLELRYLDMTAPRWWPAIAAVTATLMDDPVAADLAIEATEEAGLRWLEAARDGLGDAKLADSARRCLAIAVGRVPAQLGPAVEDLAELVESRRCPGDLLAGRAERIGPLAALREMAHA
jgi:glutamate--cysteine ligase